MLLPYSEFGGKLTRGPYKHLTHGRVFANSGKARSHRADRCFRSARLLLSRIMGIGGQAADAEPGKALAAWT
jgi:hypothetical protein